MGMQRKMNEYCYAELGKVNCRLLLKYGNGNLSLRTGSEERMEIAINQSGKQGSLSC